MMVIKHLLNQHVVSRVICFSFLGISKFADIKFFLTVTIVLLLERSIICYSGISIYNSPDLRKLRIYFHEYFFNSEEKKSRPYDTRHNGLITTRVLTRVLLPSPHHYKTLYLWKTKTIKNMNSVNDSFINHH